MRRDYFWNYTPTAPRAVEGGIKARSQRGAFASKWWGKRWLQTLESFNLGARLSRGRSYARSGQVADLDIEKGSLTARVQGSRKTPYKVTIKLKAFSDPQWRKVLDRLLDEPLLAARLLGNEMAEEMEEVFTRAGLPLFPRRQDDLVTDCSCPDWSNPCKHVAAVYFLLAEAFDSDPFLLFRLRGMEREEFLAHLREAGAGESAEEAAPAPGPVPLDPAPESFWGDPCAFPSQARPPETPGLHAALPRRLGSLPFWRGEADFLERMECLYQSASAAALERFSVLEEKAEGVFDSEEPAAGKPPLRKERPKAAAKKTEAKSAGAKKGNALLAAARAPSKSSPAKAPPAKSATAPGDLCGRILAHMQPGRAYTRAEITDPLRISPSEWTWAIRQLKERKAVRQIGERRGARYRR